MGVFALLYLAASLLAGMTYFTWFHGIAGRTPGKMLLGLRVIQASGDPMTPGIAFLRWVGYLISGPVFCLGFLWVAFDGRKQGWHDKIAATLVIRERGESDRDAYRNFTENAAHAIRPAIAAGGPHPPELRKLSFRLRSSDRKNRAPTTLYPARSASRHYQKKALTNGGIFYRKTFHFGDRPPNGGR